MNTTHPIDPSSDPINDDTHVAERANLPPEFICKITGLVMVDPVLSPRGHKADRFSFYKIIQSNNRVKCPFTRNEFPFSRLTPDLELRGKIDEHLLPETIAQRNAYYRSLEASEASSSQAHASDSIEYPWDFQVALLRVRQERAEREARLAERLEQQRLAAEQEQRNREARLALERRQKSLKCWEQFLELQAIPASPNHFLQREDKYYDFSHHKDWSFVYSFATSNELADFIADHVEEMCRLMQSVKQGSRQVLFWRKFSDIPIETFQFFLDHIEILEYYLKKNFYTYGCPESGVCFDRLGHDFSIRHLTLLFNDERFFDMIREDPVEFDHFPTMAEEILCLCESEPDTVLELIQKVGTWICWTKLSEEEFQFCLTHQDKLKALKEQFPSLPSWWCLKHRDWVIHLYDHREAIAPWQTIFPHIGPDLFIHFAEVMETAGLINHTPDWADWNDPLIQALKTKEKRVVRRHYRSALLREYYQKELAKHPRVYPMNNPNFSMADQIRRRLDLSKWAYADKAGVEQVIWQMLEVSIEAELLVPLSDLLQGSTDRDCFYKLAEDLNALARELKQLFPAGIPPYIKNAFQQFLIRLFREERKYTHLKQLRRLNRKSRRTAILNAFEYEIACHFKEEELRALFGFPWDPAAQAWVQGPSPEPIPSSRAAIYNCYREMRADNYVRTVIRDLKRHIINDFRTRIQGVLPVIGLLLNVIFFPLVLLRACLFCLDEFRFPNIFWLPSNAVVKQAEGYCRDLWKIDSLGCVGSYYLTNQEGIFADTGVSFYDRENDEGSPATVPTPENGLSL